MGERTGERARRAGGNEQKETKGTKRGRGKDFEQEITEETERNGTWRLQRREDPPGSAFRGRTLGTRRWLGRDEDWWSCGIAPGGLRKMRKPLAGAQTVRWRGRDWPLK